jgi:hypothetical protein
VTEIDDCAADETANGGKQFTTGEEVAIEQIEKLLAPLPLPMRDDTLRMVCENQRMQCLARGEVRHARAFARSAARYAARVAPFVRVAPRRHVNRHARSQRRVGSAVRKTTAKACADPDGEPSHLVALQLGGAA